MSVDWLLSINSRLPMLRTQLEASCATQIHATMPLNSTDGPESLGGRTVRENLWLCCAVCNERKGSRTSAFDNETDQRVRLFHPRRDKWTQHFRWTADGELIEVDVSKWILTCHGLPFRQAVYAASES